jgi:hypothetical protein
MGSGMIEELSVLSRLFKHTAKAKVKRDAAYGR